MKNLTMQIMPFLRSWKEQCEPRINLEQIVYGTEFNAELEAKVNDILLFNTT